MKLIYILLLLTLLSGCKVKRNLSVQTEQKFEQMEQTDIHESDNTLRDSSGQSIVEIVSHKESEAESETVTKRTEYDTSKPINPETGKPPVIRETETITKTKKKDKEDSIGKQTENSDVQNQNNKDKADKSFSSQSSHNSEDLKQSENKKIFEIPWLWIIVSVLGTFFIIYCIRKKINPVKWLLRI